MNPKPEWGRGGLCRCCAPLASFPLLRGRGDIGRIIMLGVVPPQLCRGFAAVSSVLISSHAQACSFARLLAPKDARARARELVAEGLNVAPAPTAAH